MRYVEFYVELVLQKSLLSVNGAERIFAAEARYNSTELQLERNNHGEFKDQEASPEGQRCLSGPLQGL